MAAGGEIRAAAEYKPGRAVNGVLVGVWAQWAGSGSVTATVALPIRPWYSEN